MTKCDLDRLFRAVLRFPFPADVRRSISSDLERAALYVILISSDRFAVVAFRSPLAAESVNAELADAVAGIQRSPVENPQSERSGSLLGLALDRYGRDM